MSAIVNAGIIGTAVAVWGGILMAAARFARKVTELIDAIRTNTAAVDALRETQSTTTSEIGRLRTTSHDHGRRLRVLEQRRSHG